MTLQERTDGVEIRSACDSDAASLIELIGSCFAEYPGCLLEVDGEMPELRAVATAYADRGGHFWVAEGNGRVVGCIGLARARDAAGIELQKLYVARPARRRGLGTQLCELVEGEARRRGADFVELWSDTRFTDAHRLYESLRYVRGPETRELHDVSNTVEYYFRKQLL